MENMTDIPRLVKVSKLNQYFCQMLFIFSQRLSVIQHPMVPQDETLTARWDITMPTPSVMAMTSLSSFKSSQTFDLYRLSFDFPYATQEYNTFPMDITWLTSWELCSSAGQEILIIFSRCPLKLLTINKSLYQKILTGSASRTIHHNNKKMTYFYVHFWLFGLQEKQGMTGRVFLSVCDKVISQQRDIIFEDIIHRPASAVLLLYVSWQVQYTAGCCCN